MSLCRDLSNAVEKVLTEAGVPDWTVKQVRSGHTKYRFQWEGKPVMFTTASTPSDTRATIHRAVSDLRRILGVKREVRKNPTNRAKPYRKRATVPPECPRLTPGKDPWASLAGVEAIPHHAPLGTSCMGIDTAARGLADAILGHERIPKWMWRLWRAETQGART